MNFLLFNNGPLEIMRFIHSFDNMFLFSNHNVTHMHVSKQYNENRSVRVFLTIRKHQISLLPSSNFLPKIVTFTGTVPFTYFVGYSESILCTYMAIECHYIGCGKSTSHQTRASPVQILQVLDKFGAWDMLCCFIVALPGHSVYLFCLKFNMSSLLKFTFEFS